MHGLVDDQARAVTEALPTFPTHIGSYPSVDHLVADEVAALPEALPTFSTFMGLFIVALIFCVPSDVCIV